MSRVRFSEDSNTFSSDGSEIQLVCSPSIQNKDAVVPAEVPHDVSKSMDRLNPLKIVLDIVFCSIIIIPIAVLNFAVEPFHRGFYCDDESIRYPYQSDTVTPATLVTVGLAIPIITIVVVEAYRTFYFEPAVLGQKAPHRAISQTRYCHPYVIRLYYYIGYFVFGALVCEALVDMSKFTVGRLRPHFLAVCKPATEIQKCDTLQYLATQCTGDAKLIREARLSFPSGHSSFSFYTMTFTVLYLQSQFVWPTTTVNLVKVILQFVFMSLAVLCALSRISDYMHHWNDVLAGSAVGVIMASIVSVYFVGLFRYPKQQVSVNGVVAADVETIRKTISTQQLMKNSESQRTIVPDEP